jgi:hypothetical protein
MLEQAKIFRALNRAASVIGSGGYTVNLLVKLLITLLVVLTLLLNLTVKLLTNLLS